MRAINNIYTKSKSFCDKQLNMHRIMLLVTVLFYGALIALWHQVNHNLPTSDAVAYLADAFYRYHSFFDEGFLEGLARLYGNRGWRPQIFPVFSVPFLLLFGNKPLIAVMCVSLMFGAMLVAYLYLLLRLSLSPIYASITALFIATYSVIFNYNLIFFSEIAYMPLVLATLYHLLRSDCFANQKHALIGGLFAGLITCIRPVESIVLIFMILPFFVLAVKRRTIALPHFLTVLNLVFATVVLLFYTTYIFADTTAKYIPGFIVTILAAKYLHHLYRNQANGFVIFGLAVCGIVLFYWLPAVHMLINWSLEASVGDVVQSLGTRQSLSVKELFNQLELSWLGLVLPFVLSLPIVLLFRNYRHSLHWQHLVLFFTFSLTLLLLVFMYSVSVNDNQIVRRSLSLGLIAAVLLGHIVLSKHYRLRIIPLLIIGVFLGGQVATILSTTLTGKHAPIVSYLHKVADIYAKTLYAPLNLRVPHISPPGLDEKDRHVLLAEKINKKICQYDIHDCMENYLGLFITEPVSYGLKEYMDPFSVGFASNIYLRYGRNYNLSFVFVPKHKDYYESLNERHVNFVIVQDHPGITDDMLNNTHLSHAQTFTAELIKKYRNNAFDKLKLIDSFALGESTIFVLRNPDLPL